MPSIHRVLSEQFAAFERRGRGWQVFPVPVHPEPPLPSSRGYRIPPTHDDGRVPSVGSRVLSRVLSFLGESSAKPAPTPPESPESTGEAAEVPELHRGEIVELQTSLPANLNLPKDVFEAFLGQLETAREPISFELVGRPGRIHAQFAVSRADAPIAERQLRAYFPEASFVPTSGILEDFATEDGYHAIVEYGLSREFFFQLRNESKLDPFIGLVGAMADLADADRAVYQILFAPCSRDWAEAMVDSVSDDHGKPVFANRPDLLDAALEKAQEPLYGVVVRIGARATDFDRAVDILKGLNGALRVFSRGSGNGLIPLRNDDYPIDVHVLDIVNRETHRAGMILNRSELIGFVHFPSPAVRTPIFKRQVTATKAAPPGTRIPSGIFLGTNSHAGVTERVYLRSDERMRHMHVIGASGTGKSTFLEHLLRQDLESGAGFALLDPHGDIADRVMELVPSERLDDVIVVDPADESASIGFNILSAHSDLEKTLLASDLVGIFARLSTSWGDQMEGVLRNAILAHLESTEGGTLADLRRFLLDAKYRERFLTTVTDPDIQFYWRKGFAQLTGNKSVGPILTRLETFLAPKPIRYMVAQKANRLDFADILDSGKIFIARLAQGAIGRENAYLLGSLLMAKFQQTAMARQRQAAEQRRDFVIYLDEFQNFITPSLSEILSGARKYRLGLVLAHQELRQLDRDKEVASAVLSNPYTRVVFRVGDDDARKLESGFSSFGARDLQNLGTGEAVVRMERSDTDFNLTVPKPPKLDESEARARREEVIARSRSRYATPRSEVEAAFAPSAGPIFEPAPPEPEKPAPHQEKQASRPPAPPAPPQDPPAPVPEPSPESDQVRHHTAIRDQLVMRAEALGFVATIEESVPGGTGRVDIVLRGAGRVVACEISSTTGADYEIHNIEKCLAAGYPAVVVISSNPKKLANIEAKYRLRSGPSAPGRVQFLTPDAFEVQLQTWAEKPSGTTEPPAPRKRNIQFPGPPLTEAERRAKEQQMLADLAAAMRKQP